MLLAKVTGEVDTGVGGDPLAVGAFVVYLLIVIGIGLYSAGFSSRGMTNYFIGGRSMNRLVVALSAVVSGRSSWLLLGFTGTAYMRGASALWAAVGYTVIEFFLLFFYAPRLRRFTERYDCITLPDFFAERFRDQKGILRTLFVLVILVFMVTYVSAQFVGGGKAFASSFGIGEGSGLLITAAIVLFYTVLGGFMAVSLTDMLQAFFMILALLILPFLVMSDLGGWQAVMGTLAEQEASLVDPTAIGIGALIGFVGIGLGSTGNPHILSRYMSIDDPKQLRYSAVVGTIWNVLMAFGAVLVGLTGRAVFPEVANLPDADQENIFPALAESYLPSILFGLVVASIFAAIMSTCDSQLLVASSAVVRDVYEKILRKGEALPQARMVLYSRLMVAFLVLLAVIMGWYAQKLVFWLVLFAWAGIGSAIGPVSILALFWRKTTWTGAVSGMLTGTLTTIIWYNIPVLKDAFYELIPAFVLSIIVTVVVSHFTQRPEDSEDMFRVMEGKEGEKNE